MIKRDKRNIGKEVIIHSNGVLNERRGKVVGFRGDFKGRIPYVWVFVYNLNNNGGTNFPLPGHTLEAVK